MALVLALLPPGSGADTARNDGPLTAAVDVRPILEADMRRWVTLRERRGQDRLYFTRLEKLRCGLYKIRYSVNGGEIQEWKAEECYTDLPKPNALLVPRRKRYLELPIGSVTRVAVEITYDDGATAAVLLNRSAIIRR